MFCSKRHVQRSSTLGDIDRFTPCKCPKALVYAGSLASRPQRAENLVGNRLTRPVDAEISKLSNVTLSSRGVAGKQFSECPVISTHIVEIIH
jgi:hypothetical protein